MVKLRELHGDAVQYFHDSKAKPVLLHQVNCQRKMGSGVARSIKDSYPTHFQDYIKAPQVLGTSVSTLVYENHWVAGLFGQDRYGRLRRHTDYDAFRRSLDHLYDHLLAVQPVDTIIIPGGIGSGLGGGNYTIIWDIIETFSRRLPEHYEILRVHYSSGA